MNKISHWNATIYEQFQDGYTPYDNAFCKLKKMDIKKRKFLNIKKTIAFTEKQINDFVKKENIIRDTDFGTHFIVYFNFSHKGISKFGIQVFEKYLNTGSTEDCFLKAVVRIDE